jgi:hypothetical protein
VIKVELWPYGDESRKMTIATGVIANDGTGDRRKANYDAHFANGDVDPYDIADILGATPQSPRVEGFYRDSGPWSLLRVLLNDSHYRHSGKWRAENVDQF